MSSFSLKDKVPPHNLEAEQATLGALLLDWEAVGTVIRYLRPDRFYSLQNQKVFTAILSLFNKGQRPAAATGLYWALYRYYRNTDKSRFRVL